MSKSMVVMYRTGPCQAAGNTRFMACTIPAGCLSNTSSTSNGIIKGSGTLASTATTAIRFAAISSLRCSSTMASTVFQL